MSISSLIFAVAISIFAGSAPAFAQTYQDGNSAIEITNESSAPEPVPVKTIPAIRKGSRVGRQAAAKYMAPKNPDSGTEVQTESERPRERGYSAGASDHYLAVHVGWFANDNAYKWGAADSQQNVGRYNFGLTYRMGEWVNSMDLLFRFDVARMNLADGGVTKFSLLPMVTFPDASSRFPLYFGAGIGLGVFGNQIAGESAISLDYQVVAGARFFNLWGQTGLFVEGGVKNHILLLSDGQFNGTFIATGLVFTF